MATSPGPYAYTRMPRRAKPPFQDQTRIQDRIVVQGRVSRPCAPYKTVSLSTASRDTAYLTGRGRARRNARPAQWNYERPSTIGPSCPCRSRWRVYRPSRGPSLNTRGATAHGKPGPKSSKARETHGVCPRPRGVHAVFHRAGWNLLRAGTLIWAGYARVVRLPAPCYLLVDELADGEDELPDRHIRPSSCVLRAPNTS
jgi:hypothetical protein